MPRKELAASREKRNVLDDHSAWESVGFLLWHATLEWERRISACLKPIGLTHVQFTILGSIWWLQRQGGSPNQREIAQHAGIDPVMTSKVVRALERRGLLVRMPDSDDARAWRVHLTSIGRRLAEEAVIAVEDVDAWLIECARGNEELLHLLRTIAGRDEDGKVTRIT